MATSFAVPRSIRHRQALINGSTSAIDSGRGHRAVRTGQPVRQRQGYRRRPRLSAAYFERDRPNHPVRPYRLPQRRHERLLQPAGRADRLRCRRRVSPRNRGLQAGRRNLLGHCLRAFAHGQCGGQSVELQGFDRNGIFVQRRRRVCAIASASLPRQLFAGRSRAGPVRPLHTARPEYFGFSDPCTTANISSGTQYRATNCAAAGVPANYNYTYKVTPGYLSGGNTGLKAEVSDSITLGGVLTPGGILRGF